MIPTLSQFPLDKNGIYESIEAVGLKNRRLTIERAYILLKNIRKQLTNEFLKIILTNQTNKGKLPSVLNSTL